jgi:hypothetical protein
VRSQPFVATKKKTTTTKSKKELPYWLSGDEVHCAGCDRQHAYAVEARCAACDQPHCPTCVIAVEGEVFCSTCYDEGGKTQWRRARSGKA